MDAKEQIENAPIIKKDRELYAHTNHNMLVFKRYILLGFRAKDIFLFVYVNSIDLFALMVNLMFLVIKVCIKP